MYVGVHINSTFINHHDTVGVPEQKQGLVLNAQAKLIAKITFLLSTLS